MSEWDFLTRKFSYDYGIILSHAVKNNFDKIFFIEWHSGSVTHYPSNAFAKNSKKPVILKLKGNNPYIANRKAFSPVKFLDRIDKHLIIL